MKKLEKRIMLTSEEYDYLQKRYMEDGILSRSIDYYYDTDNCDMNDMHITCRIRQEGAHYFSTIKADDNFTYGFSFERTQQVNHQWDSSMFKPLGLKFQEMLIAYRRIVCPEYGIKISANRNLYLGKEDYELEVEYIDGYEKEAMIYIIQISELLEHGDIIKNKLSFLKRIGTYNSKSERFFCCKRKYKAFNKFVVYKEMKNKKSAVLTHKTKNVCAKTDL